MPNNGYPEKDENAMYLALVALTIRTKDFTDAIRLSLKKGTSLTIKYRELSTTVVIEETMMTDVDHDKSQEFKYKLNYLVNEVAVKIPRSKRGNMHEEAEITVSGYKFSFKIIKEKKAKKFIRLKIVPDG